MKEARGEQKICHRNLRIRINDVEFVTSFRLQDYKVDPLTPTGRQGSICTTFIIACPPCTCYFSLEHEIRFVVCKNWCHFACSHFAYSHFAYSHFAYLLLLSAISPTHAKCDQNNVIQFKQAVQVCKVKGIVQTRSKNKFKWQYEKKFL